MGEISDMDWAQHIKMDYAQNLQKDPIKARHTTFRRFKEDHTGCGAQIEPPIIVEVGSIRVQLAMRTIKTA